MKSFKAKIIDPIGMHARPTSLVVGEAANYPYKITIKCNGKEANLKSIMSVMSLAIKKDCEIEIIADSNDDIGLNKIKEVLRNNKLIK